METMEIQGLHDLAEACSCLDSAFVSMISDFHLLCVILGQKYGPMHSKVNRKVVTKRTFLTAD